MRTQASHFEYDGFARVGENIKKMALDNQVLQERVRKATWEVLGAVRKDVVNAAHFKHSTHNSIASVRRSVYKKILGGSVSILDGKRKGNASKASSRTQQINSYAGKDRGFILRFVNSGTEDRYAVGRNKALSRSYIQNMRGKPGFRGSITAQNFFAPAANGSIQAAAETLAQMIDQEIAKQFNNG